ncbi:MAG: proton-conducting transporter membrane subunit, partial [Sphingomonadaceae bacterium]|nr:proton-conducting transporter membrane subunit [Sphingomonadaceae bacterium]
LIAYSSVAHMAFVTVGLFVFNQQGIEGAIITMLSHGVVSGALFLCVGIVYDRLHTREISRYGGLAKNMPVYAAFFMLFTMASVGLPGTSGFVGELLVFIGAYEAASIVAFVMLSGIILGAAYMLYLYRRVIFGTLEKAELRSMTDLTVREVAIMAPLAAVVLWMGIYPKPFLDPLHAPVAAIMARIDRAAPPTQQVVARAQPAAAAAATHVGAH